MKKQLNTNTRTILFTFDGLEPLVFNAAKASVENTDYAILNGFSHRLGDMAALSRTDGKGNVRTITEAMRREAVEAGIRHYESGAKEWELKGAARVTINPIIAKIAAARGIDYAEAEAWWADNELWILTGAAE